jgi:hypothetical protein
MTKNETIVELCKISHQAWKHIDPNAETSCDCFCVERDDRYGLSATINPKIIEFISDAVSEKIQREHQEEREPKELSTDDYESVILAQDGCNLSGILASWHRMRDRILNETRGKGTKAFNEHPINVMMASKVASLTRCEDMNCFVEAYNAVKSKAGKEFVERFCI